MNGHRTPSGWRRHLPALAIFALVSVWCMRSVLGQPATVVNFEPVPQSGALAGAVAASDLRRGVAQIAYAARSLATDPLRYFDGGMCFPSASSVAFGEHMLGEGLLGVPVHLLWNDPLVTYNFVVTVKPLIAATGMYALAYSWTGSAAGALIAGLLFGFHALRMSDLAHPSVRANEWIPLILLSLDRLFTRGRWRDAFLLALVSGLQLLESMYVLVQCAVIVPAYGVQLLVSHRRRILVLLPKLAAVAAALAMLAAWVFRPYLEMRATWRILAGQGFWAASAFYPGICLLVLACLGLLDRFLRTPRQRGNDPRIVLTAAALVLVWFAQEFYVPYLDFVVPRLAILLRGWLPGIDAIRALQNISFGVVACLAVLAAYGVRLIESKLAGVARVFAVALLAAACAAESFLPAWSRASFNVVVPSSALALRPAEDDLLAVRDLPDGVVLDSPGNYSIYWVGQLSRYVLLSAYHQRRISTCKSSFLTPVQFAINAISSELPSREAAMELWALGFRTVIFHAQAIPRIRDKTDGILAALADPQAGPHLIPIAAGRTVRVARLVAVGPVTTDIGSLVPASRNRDPLTAGTHGVWFGLRSKRATFRHPDPIRPTDLIVTWKLAERTVGTQNVRKLLPLALASERAIDIKVGARIIGTPGNVYEVTLATADEPERVLGRERILVRAAEEVAPAPERGG